MTPAELATTIVQAAADKKARDAVVLDIHGKTTIADYFVICEGDTDRQVRAIVEHIREKLQEMGLRPLSITGLDDASWACLDYDSVIAHVFLPGERLYYDLEGLWSRNSGEKTG